jgi:hypothetical protein
MKQKNLGQHLANMGVYELVVGRQRKKKGVFSREGKAMRRLAKETIEKRGTPTDGNE